MNLLLQRRARPALPALPTLPTPSRQTALMLWILAWLGLVVLLMSATAARAGALPGEVPALAGRLSAVAGDVRWFDRDSNAWVQSSEAQPLRNWPLAPGDRLRTGAGGRAELRIGSTTVRLGADAELWLPRLDEQAVLMQLQAGSLALRLAEIDRDSFGPVEVLTREGRWLPQGPGHYRLDRERDATQASAWRGELRFEGRDSALSIGAGRRADLWQDAGGTTRYAWAGIERDGFADWVARDERQDDAPISARYVPPGMTGWQDLDRHGDWLEDAQQGMVWQPRVVAPGWTPFHDGRWAYVPPWGWTWIDAAPWGFAPFHYGVWLTVGGRWSWSPGPRHHAPRYAPALSGWFSGPHLGVNINIGGRPPPPRVVVPVVIVRPAPAPRPIIVLPREHEGRDHRGPRDGREPERRVDDRRGDERRGEERRGEERRGDSGRADERRAEPRRFDAPRFEGSRREDHRGDEPRREERRDDRRADTGATEVQRPAGPERPQRQLPLIEAPAARAVTPPPPAPPTMQAPAAGAVTPPPPAPPTMQAPPQRAAEPVAVEIQRPAGPERPQRQLPQIEAPAARTVMAPPPTMQPAAPPTMQAPPQRAAEPAAAEAQRRSPMAQEGRATRSGNEAREPREPRASRAEARAERGEPGSRRGDEARRERE